MTHQNHIFLSTLLLAAALSIGGVGACTVPTDGISIVASTTLCTGTYYLNGTTDSTNLMAIRINGNNIELDGNGSVLIGNMTTNLRGLFVVSKSNFTVRNISISNYSRGMEIQTSWGNIIDSNFSYNTYGIRNYFGGLYNNSNVSNCLFFNNTQSGFQVYSATGGAKDGFNILNNTFVLVGGRPAIYEEPTVSVTYNLTIENNTIVLLSGGYTDVIRQHWGSKWTIKNNTIIGNGELYSSAMKIEGNDTEIYGNFMNLTQYSIWTSGARNITIRNNTIFNSDMGTWVLQSENISIFGNNIKNTTWDIDAYNTGLKIESSQNVTIFDNNFNEMATTAVLMQNSTNISITGNTINMIPMSSRVNYKARDLNAISCAIQPVQAYKSYYLYWGNALINFSQNTITNAQCYIDAENVTDLTTDLTGYWTRTFQFPTKNRGNTILYIPNSVDTIYTYSNGLSSNIYLSLNGAGNKDAIYNLTKTYWALTNANISSNNLVLYNLLSQSPYSDVRWGNGTIIARGTDTVSVTIPAGLYVEVGDYTCPYGYSVVSSGVCSLNTPEVITGGLGALISFSVYMIFYFIAITVLTMMYVQYANTSSDTILLLLKVVIAGTIVLGAIPIITMLPTIAQASTLYLAPP